MPLRINLDEFEEKTKKRTLKKVIDKINNWHNEICGGEMREEIEELKQEMEKL